MYDQLTQWLVATAAQYNVLVPDVERVVSDMSRYDDIDSREELRSLMRCLREEFPLPVELSLESPWYSDLGEHPSIYVRMEEYPEADSRWLYSTDTIDRIIAAEMKAGLGSNGSWTFGVYPYTDYRSPKGVNPNGQDQ